MRHSLSMATVTLCLFAVPALAASTTPDPAATAPAAAAPAAGAADTSKPKVVIPETAAPAATTPAADTAPPKSMATPAAATEVLWYSQNKDEMRASKLIGVAVLNPAGETIGDVNEVVFDASGKVNAVVVGVGGFLGMGEREVAIAFGSLHMTRGDDGRMVVMIDATKDALKSAPVWTWPKV
jgi:sporulation protein YlmC with PRC-barrel domain